MTQKSAAHRFCCLFAFACLFFAPSLYASGGLQGDNITLAKGWVRKPAPGAAHAAAFFTMHNQGTATAQLTSVACEATVARSCEMHQHIHENGKMRMQKITAGLTLPAGSDLRFSPGNYHVMLLDANPALETGQTVELVFTFSDQSTYHARLPVKPVNEE